jgi:hypothetical protein
MGIASECSMGISAEPSVSRIMSGRAFAMTGDAVGSSLHREVGVVEVSAGQVRFCGVADPTHFCCPIAETQESCSMARDLTTTWLDIPNRMPYKGQRRDGKFLVKSRKTID